MRGSASTWGFVGEALEPPSTRCDFASRLRELVLRMESVRTANGCPYIAPVGAYQSLVRYRVARSHLGNGDADCHGPKGPHNDRKKPEGLPHFSVILSGVRQHGVEESVFFWCGVWNSMRRDQGPALRGNSLLCTESFMEVCRSAICRGFSAIACRLRNRALSALPDPRRLWNDCAAPDGTVRG